jgi:type IV pilus assembly protein PilQ
MFAFGLGLFATGSSAAPSSSPSLAPEDTARLFLDVKDVDIRDVVQMISKSNNLNIVLDKDVSGVVTLHLSNAPVMEGLRTVARSRGFDVTREGSVYRIGLPVQETRSSISYSQGLLTADVHNMDVENFVQSVSNIANINIVAEGKLVGSISGRLSNVSLDEGLRALFEGSGFRIYKRSNIYRVFSNVTNPSQPRNNAYRLECVNGSVTLDVSRGELQDILKEIARQSGLEIIIYGDISGIVNATLVDIPLNEIFAIVLGGTPYTYVQNGNLVMIGSRDASTPAGIALSTSEVIPLSYLKADDVAKILPKNIPDANIKIIKEQNGIMVTGTSEDIVKTRRFIRKIDVPVPQVIIDALVVEYTRDVSRDFGLEFGIADSVKNSVSWPGIEATLSTNARKIARGNWNLGKALGTLNNSFYAHLSLLESMGKAQVLARPSITVLNGNKATIDVGQTQYFTVEGGTQENHITNFQPISFGIKLSITPWISSSGQITTEVSPEISNANGVNKDSYPNVFRRAASTTVSLGNGQTLVLGGLLQNEKHELSKGLPWISRIPLLGYLFKTVSRQNIETNLVIYITPHIVGQQGFVSLPNELANFERIQKNEKPIPFYRDSMNVKIEGFPSKSDAKSIEEPAEGKTPISNAHK